VNVQITSMADAFAVSLLKEVLFHNSEMGGTTIEIYGSKGSAKTTLMLTLAYLTYYYEGDKLKKEPCIWRARDVDMWTWYPEQSHIKVWVHENDEVSFTTDAGDDVKIKCHRYQDVYDILESLEEFNVVYEPHNYSISDDLKDMMAKRGGLKKQYLTDIDVDPTVWWFEAFYKLLKRRDNKFITVFIDEADDVFPENPSGLRWYLQEWVKNSIKDFRKRNNSLIISAHSHADIDHRIRTKMQYRVLTKGAIVPSQKKSKLDKNAPLYLKVGEAYIERNIFGKFTFNKLPKRPLIVAHFSNF